MQSLVFLWGQLQMAQQYLREEICPPEPVPGNAVNLDSLTGPVTVRPPSVNPVPRIEPAKKPRGSVTPSQNLFRLIGSQFGASGPSRAESRRRVVRHSR
jgi:hypothetical protein